MGIGARELPVIIAGAGPGGASAAMMLRRAGTAVHVFEARGEDATRARSIFMRSQAREIVRDLVGADPGRDTTIMSLENRLRAVAREERVPIDYHHRVLDVDDRGDHVLASVQRAGSDEIRSVPGRMFIDASGGRLAATNDGALERVAVGPSHVYVTAQYDSPAPFGKIFGAFDRRRSEGLFCFPISDGDGFVAYYDLPPGQSIVDEAGLLARFDTLAARLQLGTPVTPPQAFDAQQHLSRSAADGRMLKIGDSAGNADPYIGAGVAAAFVDARAAARALSGTGDPVRMASIAARDVLAGHRNLGAQAGFMRDARGIGLRMLPRAHFDESLSRADLGPSTGLDIVTRFLTSRPIRG
jgi:flavin-dependent dehydrogenase